MSSRERDLITIEDEQGIEKQYAVEALFDMRDQTYASPDRFLFWCSSNLL